MNNSNVTQSNLKNIISILAIAFITLAAFFFSYSHVLSGPIKSIIWIVWLILSLLLAYTTSKGKDALQFAIEAKVELFKVVWPNRQETIQTTMIVMTMVTLTGFILWGVDSVIMWAIAKITHLG